MRSSRELDLVHQPNISCSRQLLHLGFTDSPFASSLSFGLVIGSKVPELGTTRINFPLIGGLQCWFGEWFPTYPYKNEGSHPTKYLKAYPTQIPYALPPVSKNGNRRGPHRKLRAPGASSPRRGCRPAPRRVQELKPKEQRG